MGVLDSVFGPKHKVAKAPTTVSREPKYVEVDWKGNEPEGKQYVRVINLNDFSDVEGVLERLRDRNSVLILKVKPRLVQEKMELKRALKRIQRTCQAIGSDIAGINETVIVITPPNIEIWRPSDAGATAPTTPISSYETEETVVEMEEPAVSE